MRFFVLAVLLMLCIPAFSQRNSMMNFGGGLNFALNKGYKLNWNAGMRLYTQLGGPSFISGTIDHNRFTTKPVSFKSNFTTFRIGYEYFNQNQTFHVGADVGTAIRTGDFSEDANFIFSAGPGLMSKREKKAIWDLSLRYNYVSKVGFDWVSLRVAYGFRVVMKSRRSK